MVRVRRLHGRTDDNRLPRAAGSLLQETKMDPQELNRLMKLRDACDVLIDHVTLRDGYVYGAAYYAALAVKQDVEKRVEEANKKS